MPGPAPIRNRQEAAEQWLIYDWSLSVSSPLRSWLALLLTAAIFVALVLFLGVRMDPLRSSSPPRASIIHVPSSDSGNMLARRARAEGPFPSRFQPTDWQGAEGFEHQLSQITRKLPERHAPELMSLPEMESDVSRLARRGEPVLPQRPLGPLYNPNLQVVELIPVISPISGISADELPDQLPRLDVEAGATLTARTWTFLMRIDRSGRVLDCIALAGGTVDGVDKLASWLRTITFPASAGAGSRWVAIGVEFQNRMVNDGTDTE